MNKIEISGKITKEPVLSHENHGEKFYSTQITSVRTSGVPDTLNVTFSEIFLKNIKEDEQVEIFGEIRTMNYDGHCHIFVLQKTLQNIREKTEILRNWTDISVVNQFSVKRR